MSKYKVVRVMVLYLLLAHGIASAMESSVKNYTPSAYPVHPGSQTNSSYDTTHMHVAGLDVVDADAANVSMLKRKIELQKLQQEYISTSNYGYKKSPGAPVNVGGGHTKLPVMTDVMINQSTHQKYVTLLLSTGALVHLEEGAMMNGYVLANVSMDGANLLKYNHNGRIIKQLHIRKIYIRGDKATGSTMNNMRNNFMPYNEERSVPPIE